MTDISSWFIEIDKAILEDLIAMSWLYQRAEQSGDKYAKQLSNLGYSFEQATAPSFAHTLKQLQYQTFFRPVRVYLNEEGNLCTLELFDHKKPYYIELKAFKGKEVTILTPLNFIQVLSTRQFPIGGATRGGTNQALASHDLAHLASFAAYPRYADLVLSYCEWLVDTANNDTRVRKALESHTSLLSLRVYYLIEVLTVIVDPKKLESILSSIIPTTDEDNFSTNRVAQECEKYALINPSNFMRVISQLHNSFHELVEPLGGESRDVLNRHRKHAREHVIDGNEERYGAIVSKFAGNSLYSLRARSKDAMAFVRSDDHLRFISAVKTIHAPFIAAMIGTSRIAFSDWFAHTIIPDQESSVAIYVTNLFSGESKNLFRLAFTSPAYDSYYFGNDHY